MDVGTALVEAAVGAVSLAAARALSGDRPASRALAVLLGIAGGAAILHAALSVVA